MRKKPFIEHVLAVFHKDGEQTTDQVLAKVSKHIPYIPAISVGRVETLRNRKRHGSKATTPIPLERFLRNGQRIIICHAIKQLIKTGKLSRVAPGRYRLPIKLYKAG